MEPRPELFQPCDFRDIAKISPGNYFHCRGVVVGEVEERITQKGEDQIHFSLMDRFKRTVHCITHNAAVTKDVLADGTHIAFFYVNFRDGLKENNGSLWIYNTTYALVTGKSFLAGTALEEVLLRSKA